MATTSRVPSYNEISPTAGLDLDERCAVNHFLGLDQEAALRMFQDAEGGLEINLGDLVHMGDAAFNYYLPAVAQYLDGLSDEDFAEEADDSVDYMLIRFSDCATLPPEVTTLSKRVKERLKRLQGEPE